MICNEILMLLYGILSWRNTLIAAGVLILIALLSRPRRKPRNTARNNAAGNAGERRVITEIRNGIRGMPAAGGFAFLPGGKRSNSVQMDAVVKGIDRIWLLEIKNWSGTVFADNSDKWTVKGKGTWSTVNPVVQLRRQCRLLSEETGVPVNGFVVMAGRAVPAKGFWPHTVVGLSDITRVLGEYARNRQPDGVSPERTEAAWKHILLLRETDRINGISAYHAQRMHNKGRPRPALPIAAVIAAVLIVLIKIAPIQSCP